MPSVLGLFLLIACGGDGGLHTPFARWLPVAHAAAVAATGGVPASPAAGAEVTALRARILELEAERDAWRRLAELGSTSATSGPGVQGVAGNDSKGSEDGRRSAPAESALPRPEPAASDGAGNAAIATSNSDSMQEIEFVGCKSGGSWVRPFGDVMLTQDGIERCIRRCQSAFFHYVGFECPMRDRSRVHCQCAKHAEINEGTTSCARVRGHCNGASVVAGYDMGGWAVGSVYRLRRAGVGDALWQPAPSSLTQAGAEAAAGEGSSPAAGTLQHSGGRVFLLTAFSHDDIEQWSLIPHWFSHYRDFLGIDPRNFLMILHSDAKNGTGVARMAARLRAEYGVEHMYPNLEPYTSNAHWILKVRILHEHVSDKDWVFQVDNDELVVFPQGLPLHVLLQRMDEVGQNVHYGVMVDRLPDDGDIDKRPDASTTLFEQYPQSCAITQILQSSDIRKVSLYRGYLRSTSGNHNIILNQVDFNASSQLQARHPQGTRRILQETEAFFDWYAPGTFRLLPLAHKAILPVVKPTEAIATVFHFKWIKGLQKKIFRRLETEQYTSHQYALLRKYLTFGTRFGTEEMQSLCKHIFDPNRPERPLPARDLIDLIFNAKGPTLDAMVGDAGLSAENEDPYLHSILSTLVQYSILHEVVPW